MSKSSKPGVHTRRDYLHLSYYNELCVPYQEPETSSERMACPAGYGSALPPTDHEVENRSINSSSEKTMVSAAELPPVTLYPPAAEPDILKRQIMPEPIVLMISGEYAILYQWLKYGLARGSVV